MFINYILPLTFSFYTWGFGVSSQEFPSPSELTRIVDSIESSPPDDDLVLPSASKAQLRLFAAAVEPDGLMQSPLSLLGLVAL